jgi:uncharacterized membrane protein
MELWESISLLSTYVLPQLLGVLLYFRLLRFSKWLAFALGVLAPAVIFYFVSPAFFYAGMREAAAQGALMCGTPFLVAAAMVLSGTVASLLIAIFVQVGILLCKRRFT